MLAIERKNEILDKLRAEQRVLVSDLAEYYHVTEETIRRDLDKLEKEGYATKTYGGAILGNSTKTDLSYAVRNKANVEAKKVIYHPEQDQRGCKKSDRCHCQPSH